MIEQICQIQSYLVQIAKQVYQSHDVNNFVVFINEKDDLPYLNYSIPTKVIDENIASEYSKIEQIFKENHRKVRFEFLEEYNPLLPSLLSSVGLTEEYRTDFMICTESDFIQPISIDGFLISTVNSCSTIQQLKEFKLVQELSFNKNATLRLESVDERNVLERIGSGSGFTGYLNNISVCASQYTAILDGITELVGIATLPDFRCRGLGAAISAAATQFAFSKGANIVCLSAADERAGSVYTNIGFRKIATMLAYS